MNEDDKTVTMTLRDDLKWADGGPVTVDDVISGYEAIASPEPQGEHFDLSESSNVEGMEESLGGKADHISSLKKSMITR